MHKKSVLYSPRLEELKNKKKKLLRLRIFLFLFLFVTILFGLTYASRAQKFNISSIEITGNKVIDADKLKKIAADDMMGKYLWLFPKTNFILYPKNKIKKDLTSQFSRIQSISFNTSTTNTLTITITERDAEYTWCGAALPEPDAADQTCYFLDANGYIFDTAPYFSGDVYTRFYGKDSVNVDAPLGSSFAPELFSKLTAFKTNAVKLGLKPTAFLITDDKHVDMYLAGGTPPTAPKIIWNTTDDFDKVLSNLASALGTDPLRTEFKTKYPFLLYIDLSFGDKVYFKFQ